MQEYAYAVQKTRQANPKRRPSIKIRYTNRTKVLLCYAVAWSLALLLPMAGLVWVFPAKLVGTAPPVAEHLAAVIPQAAPWLEQAIQGARVTEGMGAQALEEALAARDLQWRLVVGSMGALFCLLSLLAQLGWRSLFIRPIQAAKATRRALRAYRLSLLGIALLNGLGVLLIYFLGMRFIGGRMLWDWLLYMGSFGLNVLAAFVCFRLAAPPAISGKHGFFKRL